MSLTGARLTPAPISSPDAPAAGLVAFSSDTLAESTSTPREATLPSLRRQKSRRRWLTIAGAAGAGLLAVLIGALRISGTSSPTAGSASVSQESAPGYPAAPPPAPESSVAPGVGNAPVVSIDSLPAAAKDHSAPGAVHKLHKAGPAKKRPSILDSPD